VILTDVFDLTSTASSLLCCPPCRPYSAVRAVVNFSTACCCSNCSTLSRGFKPISVLLILTASSDASMRQPIAITVGSCDQKVCLLSYKEHIRTSGVNNIATRWTHCSRCTDSAERVSKTVSR
jgi:hypothetical protein